MLLALFAGLLAGVVHVFTGPDHLAAVAPLSTGRAGAWRTGAVWGLGHSGGVLVLGLTALAFRDALPMDVISSWSERVVGLVLIGMGLWCLRLALRRRVHTHEHEHEGRAHAHYHVHAEAVPSSKDSRTPHKHTHAALAIGALHGFAGGAHLVGVVPAVAFPVMLEGATYLCGYGIGTIFAMGAFASAFGALSRKASTLDTPGYRRWMGACGGAALTIGGCWLFLE